MTFFEDFLNCLGLVGINFGETSLNKITFEEHASENKHDIARTKHGSKGRRGHFNMYDMFTPK